MLPKWPTKQTGGRVAKSPAFQFYVGDFLVGVMGMPNDDVGVYIKLLCLQWANDSLPADAKELATLAGARKPVSIAVLAKLPVADDGRRRNVRLERERAKQESYRDGKAAAGAAGGRANAARLANGKHKPSTATDSLLANGKQNVALQSSSSSSEIPLSPPQAGDGNQGGRRRSAEEKFADDLAEMEAQNV